MITFVRVLWKTTFRPYTNGEKYKTYLNVYILHVFVYSIGFPESKKNYKPINH